MIVEKLDVNLAGDLREENEDIHTRHNSFSPDMSEVHRLSFFTRRIRSLAELRSADDDDFIGYVITKSDEIPGLGCVKRIYESVTRPSRHPHNFIRGSQTWECCVAGSPFHVTGYVYAQQNNVTNVCAHVALRTVAARFHRDGDMSYREMNRIQGVDIDHITKKAGGVDGDGLSHQQMIKILETAGARCLLGNYASLPPTGTALPPFQKYLYGSIESGFPAIVFFGTTQNQYHTIPVFGHTLNEDTWVPSAERSYFKVGSGTKYVPSESWVSTYIAHDDNWGSNFCVPRHFLYTRRNCQVLSSGSTLCPTQSECVVYVIATLPKEVKASPIDAEIIGADYLFSMLGQFPSSGSPWASRLTLYANDNLLVLRPILVDSDEYVTHLEEVSDWQGRRIRTDLIKALRTLRQKRLWLVELSVPELFSANRRKVGEVLLKGDVLPGQKRDFRSFLLARLPGFFALYNGGGPQNPEYRFIPSGCEGHVELFGCEVT